jgi:hypothetical protein
MRVVQDPAEVQRRRGDAAPIADPDSFEVVGGAGIGIGIGIAASATIAGETAKSSLPLLPAGLFLLACAAGGVLVAVIRPLGLG